MLLIAKVTTVLWLAAEPQSRCMRTYSLHEPLKASYFHDLLVLFLHVDIALATMDCKILGLADRFL